MTLLNITAIPTSTETTRWCESGNIPLYQGDHVPPIIDLTIDGADEFDPSLNLVKGGGGDLLWEKIIATASKQEIIIVDSSKQVSLLCESFPLPVEVIPYSCAIVEQKLTKLQLHPVLRKKDGAIFLTDEKNYIFDCHCNGQVNPYYLAEQLKQIVGIVEHGFFLKMTNHVIMGTGDTVKHFYSQNKIVPDSIQKKTFQTLFSKLKKTRALGITPIIEVDLDLTAFETSTRTKIALQTAGEKFEIEEFKTLAFDLLPGYTREAWVSFLSRNHLPERYPHLIWMGEKDGKDGRDSVYATFHTTFWKTELLSSDTINIGLKEFIEKVREEGGEVVFVSGRWQQEQIEPTKLVFEKAGIFDVALCIGNPNHDGDHAISDSEAKALFQTEICQKYGTPIACIDDRKENRDAICAANPDLDLLSIGIAIPGFTYDEEITGIDDRISTFLF